MKTIRYTIMILTILTTLALVACGQVESIATPEPTPTATPKPTPTAIPEPTPTPCIQPSDIVQLVIDQIVDTIEARTGDSFESEITLGDNLKKVIDGDRVYTYTGDFELKTGPFSTSQSFRAIYDSKDCSLSLEMFGSGG